MYILDLSMTLIYLWVAGGILSEFYSQMVFHVKANKPLGTQKTVWLDFDEESAREGRQENFKTDNI